MVDVNVDDLEVCPEDSQADNVNRRHFYALYTFHSIRSGSQKNEQKLTECKETNKSEEDGDTEELSLSIVATNLNAVAETELRKYLVQRLSKGVDCVGSGNVVPLDTNENSEFPAVCYYCLWKSKLDVIGGCTTPAISSIGDYLVCFLSDEVNSLEHFRVDLDDYSGGVLQYLDPELTKLNTSVKDYLQAWPQIAMDYLCRCLKLFQMDIQVLIYCALVGAKVEIDGGTDELKTDVRKFLRSCTLDGFNLLKCANVSGSSEDSWQALVLTDHCGRKNSNRFKNGGSSVQLCVTEEKVTWDSTCGCSCGYSRNWANKLVNGNTENAVYLKVVIDTYKLQCIQHINTMNRLLKLAENNYYALYRAYVFLKNSEYGSILLKYCRLLDLKQHDKNALQSLEEFIDENGGFFPS